jgi:hypothetical protein
MIEWISPLRSKLCVQCVLCESKQDVFKRKHIGFIGSLGETNAATLREPQKKSPEIIETFQNKSKSIYGSDLLYIDCIKTFLTF